MSGGGTIPAALTKKLKEVGAGERAPDSEKTSDVLASAARAANVQLRPDAAKLVAAHLGEDAGRVGSFVEVLRSAYGDGATLDADDVAPYLGEAGAVPVVPAHERDRRGRQRGRARGAAPAAQCTERARCPRRCIPLQVLSTLLGYYRRLLRLDDDSVQSSADAIAALGGRVKEFPARKALSAARSLGTDGIRQAFDALHQADLDIKGARGIPPDAVVEVLVVRLARLSRASGRGAGRRRR